MPLQMEGKRQRNVNDLNQPEKPREQRRMTPQPKPR